MCVCLCGCVSVCVCACVCAHECVRASLSHCPCVSFCLSLFTSLPVYDLFVHLCLCERACVFVRVQCLFFYACACLRLLALDAQDMERRGSKNSILGTLGLGEGAPAPASLQQRRPSFQALGESMVRLGEG